MKRLRWIFPAALCALAACAADDQDPQASSFPGDWTPPAGFWSYEGPARLLSTEADSTYQTGSYGVADPASGSWVLEGELAHADAVASCAGAWLLVINRLYGDNLQFVDPVSGLTVGQWSTGNGSNPYAVVFHGERAFVSLYDADYLLVAHWATGAEEARIDLSAWADDDGLPEAGLLFASEEAIWLVLQRMDRTGSWLPADQGLLLGIDPQALEVFAEIPLGLENPSGSWTVDEGVASSAAVGRYGSLNGEPQLDGAAFAVDLESESVQLLLGEEAVGRDIYDALPMGERLWLSTYDQDWQNRLEIWDAQTQEQVAEVGSGYFSGWAAGDSVIWVADYENAQLLELDQDGQELGSLDTLLRPASVAGCGL